MWSREAGSHRTSIKWSTPISSVDQAPGVGAKASSVNATADRAVEMLLCFSAARPVWTLAELAERLAMPRSTAYRYAATLRSSGFLVEDHGHLSIGPKVVELARTARMNMSVIPVATPHVKALHARFGETVSVHQRIGHEIVALDVIQCSHPLRLTFVQQNDMLPWPATANGKVFLAMATADEADALLRAMTPVRFTPRTLANKRAMRAEMARIRAQGFSVSDEERYEGLRGVAAPIPAPDGGAFALSLGAPTFRMDDARLAEAISAVVGTAKAIVADLQEARGA